MRVSFRLIGVSSTTRMGSPGISMVIFAHGASESFHRSRPPGNFAIQRALASIFLNCYRTRRGFHGGGCRLSRAQLKIDARFASALIDGKIKELADWRGKTLEKVREIIHEADREI